VIKTEEQLYEYVRNGYKPYLMKSVNRWYLRRGRERHVIDRRLEPLAQSIREKMLRMERPPLPVSVIHDMRRSGLNLQAISEATGLSRSTIYSTFEKKPDDVVKPRTYTMGNVEIKEEMKAVNPMEEIWKGITDFFNNVGKDIDKLSKRLLSDKEFVENIKKLISSGTASLGTWIASNVENEELRQALLKGAKDVLEKAFQTQTENNT
jgi:predicted DNA-binding transcriptional regulator AlpA